MQGASIAHAAGAGLLRGKGGARSSLCAGLGQRLRRCGDWQGADGLLGGSQIWACRHLLTIRMLQLREAMTSLMSYCSQVCECSTESVLLEHLSRL